MSTQRFMTVGVFATVLLGGAAAPALAETPSALYVNPSASGCSDTGPGTSAEQPFCSPQVAADQAQPGQTVRLYPASYATGLKLSRSGTADSPIRFEAYPTPNKTFLPGSLQIDAGVHNLALTDLGFYTASIQGASDIAFDRGRLSGLGTDIPLSIGGDSHHIRVTRTRIVTPAVKVSSVAVSAPAHDVVLSTNTVYGGQVTDTVTVAGAQNVVVTSNTIRQGTRHALSVSGAAIGTVIENNVLINPSSATQAGAKLAVAADSTAQTTALFNAFSTGVGQPYTWGGTDYQTAAQFQAATGQGRSDVLGAFDGSNGGLAALPELVDSADASAPGELDTDVLGNARVDHPGVANTGGSIHDRGAFESIDRLSSNHDIYALTDSGAGIGLRFMWSANWYGLTVTSRVNWGDGSPETTKAAQATPYPTGDLDQQHVYQHPGSYTITSTVTDGVVTNTRTQATETLGNAYTALTPTRIMDTRESGDRLCDIRNLHVVGQAGVPAGATEVVLNVTATDSTGPGFLTVGSIGYPGQVGEWSNVNYATGQTVANLVTAPLAADGTVQIYARSGCPHVVVDIAGYYAKTSAAGYTPVTPTRLVDTREGTGTGGKVAKLGPGQTLQLKITGQAGIPTTGVTAAALNLTVTGPTGPGFISAYPAGGAHPGVSNLNYVSGQTVANAAIVQVSADGTIELRNTSASTTDFVVDVSGYYTATGGLYFVPRWPTRIVDTRADMVVNGDTNNHSPLLPFGTYRAPVRIDPAHAVPVMNVTVTNTRSTGFLTAFPEGSRPNASNLNWTPGLNVPAMTQVGRGADGTVSFYNGSNGSTDLVVDVFGYFV
ncbi:hypothetical protein Lfu02_25310 [Longispora fulva]|uniref:PKD domain-containing protein n=1 Tax=Longispora fulva TaxID=619741 RepID=A0A8J7KYL4_9ACTN|nr:hypothetical protein [Longispora fulva]MBG6139457.1 hypothetical protein [Longispora fulva]GIG58159.1 hypothetical protein Lfu02_25310 [Longispora fulva]